MSFSPDGSWLVSVDDQGMAIIWDVVSGKVLRSLKANSGIAKQAALSPDGTILAIPDSDGQVWLFNPESGSRLPTPWFGEDGIGGWWFEAVAFAPDGGLVVAAARGAMFVWQPGHIKLTWSISKDADVGVPQAVLISPDGRWIVTTYESEPGKVWNMSNGAFERALGDVNAKVSKVTFSPDGRLLYGASEAGVYVWDFESGAVLKRSWDESAPVIDRVEDIELVPGKNMVIGLSSSLRAYHAGENFPRSIPFSEAGFAVPEWAGGFAHEFALSAVGHLAIGDGGQVNIYAKGSTVAPDMTIGESGAAEAGVYFKLLASADGKQLLTTAMGQPIRKWDLSKGVMSGIVCDGAGANESIASTSNLSVIALTPATLEEMDPLRTCDVATGDLTPLFAAEGSGEPVLSADGRFLASGDSWKRGFRVWATKDRSLVYENKDTELFGAQEMEFSPDGRLLAVGTYLSSFDDDSQVNKAEILLFDTGRKKVRTLLGGGISDAASKFRFSDDSSILVAAGPDKIRAFDIRMGTLRTEVELDWGDAGSLWEDPLAISPDLTRVVMKHEGQVALFDVSSGKLAAIVPLPNKETPASAAFLGDGERLAVIATSGSTHLIDLATSELIVTLRSDTAGNWLAITPEGFFSANPGGVDMVNLTKGFEVVGVRQLFQSLYRPDLVEAKLADDPRGEVARAASSLNLNTVMNSGSPPEVAMEKIGEVQGNSVEVVGRIAAASGGIGRIEWRIENVTVGVEEADRPEGTFSSRRRFTLGPGHNKIEVVAYNRQNMIASRPAVITVEGPAEATKPRLFVLTVAVDSYQNPDLRLSFSVADVNAVAKALSRNDNVDFESVTVHQIADSAVSTAAIGAAFDNLSRDVRPNDFFLFFVAGHGKTDNGRFYFILPSFDVNGQVAGPGQSIGQEELQTWFSRVPARNSLFLADTCESGTLLANQEAASGSARLAAIDRLAAATGRTIMAASAGDAPALEGIDGHGVFTYALLDAFGRADLNKNKRIEVSELSVHVSKEVPLLSERRFGIRQEPQITRTGNDFSVATLAPALVRDQKTLASETRGLPSYVIVKQVFGSADFKGQKRLTTMLERGARVSVIKRAKKAVLVSSGGKKYGWVPRKTVACISQASKCVLN